jgi:SAM-dependent methyltransferase
MLGKIKKKIASAFFKKEAEDERASAFPEEELQKLPADHIVSIVLSVIGRKVRSLEATDSLKLLFELERRYIPDRQAAIRYGPWVHEAPAHQVSRLFHKNIGHGSRVLMKLRKVAGLRHRGEFPDVFVFGIDSNENSIKICRENFALKNITYVHGDALTDLPDENFDVIVLSNVLEHIEKRVEFLRVLDEKYKPGKILVRVPMFERDWRVPLKKELGIDYRLDGTHYIEYTRSEFFDEVKNAGMSVSHHEIAWGEIWASVAKQSR